MDGEIDLAPFIDHCRSHNIEVYLPILHQFKPTLWFAKYDVNSIMRANKFGIPEPLYSDPIRPWQLNWVLFPLVGFDEQGGRLGMGGGFYDRTFANALNWPKKPKMFGVAHECQKVEKIPLEAWDIELDGVFSNKQKYTVSDA
jgi:5-formyltetrahydrofolate cyclo-ligase